MARIRGLELLFNLEKKNFKSPADCIVAACHCLLINEGLQCTGTGDVWPDSPSETTTEMLPKNWNEDQEVYSLRYISKDKINRVLLKIARADHMLLVNAVMNESSVATMSVHISSQVAENYEEFSSAYKDLDSLIESFRKDIMQTLTKKPKETAEKPKEKIPNPSSTSIPPPPRPAASVPQQYINPSRPLFPRVGGNDLDPFGGIPGAGGMLMDPSGFGAPQRPMLPQFGGPGGLPRGSVPPGARFDPFMPPIHPSGRFDPNPDHFKPPDYDDFI